MINYLSLFSGIGSPEKALENLEIPFNLVNYCEIDKYASKSFSAIHNVPEDLNLWDVTKINADTISERIDLITYGFPCQDISVAGKQRGFTDEEGNRMPKIETSEQNYRIRKLTPSECYKLMGFTDEDCKKASDAGISNSQLYKQAGNSIVVQVMEALFRSLGEKYEDFRCPGIKTSPD